MREPWRKEYSSHCPVYDVLRASTVATLRLPVGNLYMAVSKGYGGRALVPVVQFASLPLVQEYGR